MRAISIRVALLLGAVVLVNGCKCGEQTQLKQSKLELPSGTGSGERTVIDFGSVQVGTTATAKLRAQNNGTAEVIIDGLTAAAPFGVATMPPVTIEPAKDFELEITFAPVAADQQVSGTLTIASNDTARPSITVELKGLGVSAVAAVAPNPVDFGDVYVKETKKLTVTVVNQGSSPLVVTAAQLTGTTTGVSGDLSKLATTIAAGMSAATELTWAPMALTDVAGSLELSTTSAPGGKLTVPVKGKASQAMPRLCFRREGSAMETCTDATTTSLSLSLGAACDDRVMDGGCGDAGIGGSIYFKNEGNSPVSFSTTWTPYPYGAGGRCDGGSTASDYAFSNSPTNPDGGRPNVYSVATVKLPMNATDPKPWETAAVAMRYRPRSWCKDDTSDDARIIWTRQGDPVGTTREPGTLSVFFNGRSQLPNAKPVDGTFATTGAAALPSLKSFEIENQGDAPMTVSRVELWQEFLVDGGSDAGGPNGGFFFPCEENDPGACSRYVWDGDAGDPNRQQHTVPPGTVRSLGTLVFGPGGLGCLDAGAACPGTTYLLYGVVTTSDPYQPKVITRISGRAQ